MTSPARPDNPEQALELSGAINSAWDQANARLAWTVAPRP
jgi:hypothetical protein